MGTRRDKWAVSHDGGRSFQCYTSLAPVSHVLAQYGIAVSPSRLYNEVHDAHCRKIGLATPVRRVLLAPMVVIKRMDCEH